MEKRSSVKNLARLSACFLAALFLISGIAAAQATLGTLQGKIADEQGGGLPGVDITMKNADTGYAYNTVSRGDGGYTIAGIQPGKYEIEVSLVGFEKQKRLGLTFSVGAIVKVDFVLKPSALSEEVTVTAQTPMIEVTKSDVSKVIDRSKIDNLPLLDRSFSALAMMKAGVANNDRSNGQPQGSEEVTVDGVSNERVARNDQKTAIPADAVEEFRVMTNQFAAEYGHTSGMIWTVITRSGTNDLRGRLSYFKKDDTFDDVNYFVNHTAYQGPKLSKDQYVKPAYNYDLFGAVLGGPIKKDKAHFFITYQGQRENTNVQITSPLVPQESVNVPIRNDQLMVKLNYQINQKNLISFRYNLEDVANKNQGIGTLNTKERGFDWVNTNHEFQANWLYYPSGNTMNELRVQYSTQDGEDKVHYPDTYTIDRPSGLFGKPASYPQGGGETRIQIVDNFSVFLDKHSLKFGVDFSTIKEDIFAYYMMPGYFVFTTDEPFNPADFNTYPLMFVYNVGSPFVNIPYQEAAVFAQDSWKVSDRLSINAGLRWNYYNCPDINIDHSDLHHLNPRLGFSYDPIGDGKTTIRGGFGTFTQNPQLNIGLFGALIGNLEFRTMIYPNYPDPFQPNPFFPTIPGELPQDGYDTAPDMAPPTTTQITLGGERQFMTDLSVGLDFVLARGRHFTRVENWNPIIPGTRNQHVDPTIGNRYTFADNGRSDYKAMYLTVTKRYSHGWSLDIAYTLSSSKSDVESEQSKPWSYDDDAWERQYGPNAVDARHRLVISGIVDLPFGIQLGGLFAYNSALPWNAVYAQDLNLDSLRGDYVDQYRNSRRGFDYQNFNLRLSKSFTFKKVGLQVLAEAFNVFNKANFAGVYPYYGTANFGKPLAADMPRQIQLGARIDF